MDLLQPKDVEIKLQDGTFKTFVISKFPAVQGREIMAKYPTSHIPKIGDYGVAEEVMLKLTAYVGVRNDETGHIQTLGTMALVNNHIPDWEALGRIEWAMLEYNCSFFANGMNSDFFESIIQKAAPWISKTLTALLQQLSKTEKPPSKN